MPKNKVLRFVAYGFAVWIVLSLAVLATIFLYKGAQQVGQPSTSSIVAGLKSQQESERKAAIEKIKHPVWSDPAIVTAVSDLALIEDNPYIKSRAIIFSLQGFGRYENLNRQQLASTTDAPALTLEKIDRISSLALEEPVDSYRDHKQTDVYNSLHTFLQNTINVQDDPGRFVKHSTGMIAVLIETEGSHRKKAKIVRLLRTLRSYAAHVTLPDETLSVLLKAYDRQNGRSTEEAALVIEALNNQASKQEYREEILKLVETVAIDHKSKTVRSNAISALRQQSILTGRLNPALEKALNDKNDWNAQGASSAIAQFNETQGEKTGQGSDSLLATAFDKTRDPRLRATSLRSGIKIKNGKVSIEPKFFEAAEALRDDPEPVVRAASLYYILYMRNHELYQGRDSELIAWLETALQDEHPAVRGTALHILETFPDDNALRNRHVAERLQDDDRNVVLGAMTVVRVKKLNTPEIVKHIRRLSEHEDTAIRSYAKRDLVRLEVENRNFFQNVMHILSDRKNYGGLWYLAAAILALGVGTVFSLFYAWRFIQLAMEKRPKAVVAFVVLMVWGGVSTALGSSFVLGLFGMGHNTPAPLDEQLKISTGLTGLVGGYTVLGFIMYLFVREPKKKNKPGQQS